MSKNSVFRRLFASGFCVGFALRGHFILLFSCCTFILSIDTRGHDMRRYNNWYYGTMLWWYVVYVRCMVYIFENMVGNFRYMHYHREVRSTDSYTIIRENVVL
jgi:hypothetical protein